jgi:signal transduction histidine kinase
VLVVHIDERDEDLRDGRRTWRARAEALRTRSAALGDRVEAAGSSPPETIDRPTASDWLFTALVSSIPVAGFVVGPQVVPGRWHPPVWVGVLVLAAQLVPLAWRRVAPHRVISVVGWSTGLYFLLGFAYVANIIGVVVALYAEAAYGDRRTSGIVSLLISFGFIGGFAVMNASHLDRHALPIYALNVFGFATAWAAGDAVRSRRLHLDELRARAVEAEESRAMAAEHAVLEERTRVARELHDLIAHTVSVMVVQAGAGRRVADVDPARGREALAAVEETGRAALTELRRLVAVLRQGDREAELFPQPGLDAVPDLLATLQDAGFPVRLQLEGIPRDVPPSIEVCAYRVIQEALTNVLKHAGHVRDVQVTVEYGPDQLTIEVVDDGRGLAGGSDDGAGLVGMRERVALFGGSIQAGPRADGGYRVRAGFPTTVSEPAVRPGA